MSKIKTYRSDDYIGIDFGKYHLYFGYEYTYCSKCKKYSFHESCDEHVEHHVQWCFVAKKGKEIIFQRPIKDSEFDAVEQGFCIGVGHFLKTLLK